MEAFWVMLCVLASLFAGIGTAAAHQAKQDSLYRRARKWHYAYTSNSVDIEGNNLFPTNPYSFQTQASPEPHHLFKQVFPGTQLTLADAIPLNPDADLTPAVQTVETNEPTPEATTLEDAFWLWVQPFLPLQRDITNVTTRQAIWQAQELEISQNQMVKRLFGLSSKGSKSYYEAVAIIKDVRSQGEEHE